MTAARTWAIATLAALALTACSWRLETPEPEWPSPDAVTVMRDEAAAREDAVAHAIATSAGAGTPQTVVLEEIEGAAVPLRLEALGGLYVAYPDASPSPLPSSVPTDVAGEVAAARDGHLAQAPATEDPDLRALLASAGLSHALSSWFATWVDDAIAQAAQPIVAERSLPSPSLPVTSLVPHADDPLETGQLAQLALEHDRARYAYEVLAARAEGDERAQWLARRDLQDARAQALVELPGVDDLREAVYVLTPDQAGDSAQRLATAITLETDLGATYAALAAAAGPAQMPWLLNAAFDAYAQACAYGEPTTQEYVVPALPGIEPSAP